MPKTAISPKEMQKITAGILSAKTIREQEKWISKFAGTLGKFAGNLAGKEARKQFTGSKAKKN